MMKVEMHKHMHAHTRKWQQGHWVDEHVATDERPQECMINIWSLAQQICKPSINLALCVRMCVGYSTVSVRANVPFTDNKFSLKYLYI